MDGLNLLPERVLAIAAVNQFDGRAHEVLVSGDEVEALDGAFQDHILEGDVEQQGMVERAARGVSWESEGSGAVRLRVAVNDERGQGLLCERGPEVDGGGRLADAALPIGNGDDAPHSLPTFLKLCKNLAEPVVSRKVKRRPVSRETIVRSGRWAKFSVYVAALRSLLCKGPPTLICQHLRRS